MTETGTVSFAVQGRCGVIILRNERALNALTLPMIHLIRERMEAWRAEGAVDCVLMEGAGDRAFCAGGDVRAVALAGRARDQSLTRDFFWHEYRLNRLIGTYPIPFVALIDGVTMGGGVGLSAHGTLQVATERTLWAMPETAIGFFPDVGASHVLNRLEPAMAAFLALTGWRLRAPDLMALGLATHMVPADRRDALKGALAADAADPAAVVGAFAAPAGDSELLQRWPEVAEAFGAPTVEAILDRLGRAGDTFAGEVAALIGGMSPTSCKVVLAQLRRTRGLSLDDCLRLEFRMSQQFMRGHEFYEGIRALLIDKDRAPRWRPATLAEVSDDLVDSHFAPVAGGELEFPNGR